MSYTQILKMAYTITINHPRLWFFGLFLVGGFNALVLHTLGVTQNGADPNSALASMLQVQTKAGVIVLAVSVVLVSIIISNIARISLVASVIRIIRTESIFKPFVNHSYRWLTVLPEYDPEHELVLRPIVRRSFKATLVASMCANGFLLAAILAVGSPQIIIAGNGAVQALLLSLIMFLPLSFLALYINMFPPYFTILFGSPIRDGFRMAHDLLGKKWKEIVGFILVLLVVYGIGFTAVFSIVQYAQQAFQFTLEPFAHLGFFSLSAIISPVRIAGSAIAWLLLAVLNTFFNIALLLLFIQLIKPSADAEAVTFAPGYGIPQHASQK
jgi:hypothetical protein